MGCVAPSPGSPSKLAASILRADRHIEGPQSPSSEKAEAQRRGGPAWGRPAAAEAAETTSRVFGLFPPGLQQ